MAPVSEQHGSPPTKFHYTNMPTSQVDKGLPIRHQREKKSKMYLHFILVISPKATLSVMARTYHQKRQVVGSSLGINLSQKQKLGVRLPIMTPPRPRKKWKLCALDMTLL